MRGQRSGEEGRTGNHRRSGGDHRTGGASRSGGAGRSLGGSRNGGGDPPQLPPRPSPTPVPTTAVAPNLASVQSPSLGTSSQGYVNTAFASTSCIFCGDYEHEFTSCPIRAFRIQQFLEANAALTQMASGYRVPTRRPPQPYPFTIQPLPSTYTQLTRSPSVSSIPMDLSSTPLRSEAPPAYGTAVSNLTAPPSSTGNLPSTAPFPTITSTNAQQFYRTTQEKGTQTTFHEANVPMLPESLLPNGLLEDAQAHTN